MDVYGIVPHSAIYDLIRFGTAHGDFGDLAGSSCPGVPVMCFGLRTDFRSRLFEGSKRLMELADSIEEASARGGVCRYSECSHFSYDYLYRFRFAKDMNRYTAIRPYGSIWYTITPLRKW